MGPGKETTALFNPLPFAGSLASPVQLLEHGGLVAEVEPGRQEVPGLGRLVLLQHRRRHRRRRLLPAALDSFNLPHNV